MQGRQSVVLFDDAVINIVISCTDFVTAVCRSVSNRFDFDAATTVSIQL